MIKKRPWIILKAKNSFKQKANKLHNFKYNYDKTIYVNSKTKIEILCKSCKTSFWQTPNNHLRGRGCPKCASNRGWSKSEWLLFCERKSKTICKVYILLLFNDQEKFIKVGLTSNSVKRRYDKYKMPYDYVIIKEYDLNPGNAWDTEKIIHKYLNNYSYLPKIKFEGMKECFNSDALKVIDSIIIPT